jgi:hypothetical protein
MDPNVLSAAGVFHYLQQRRGCKSQDISVGGEILEGSANFLCVLQNFHSQYGVITQQKGKQSISLRCLMLADWNGQAPVA